MATLTYTCSVPNVATAEEQRRQLQAECVREGLTPDAEFSDDGEAAWRLPLRDRPGGRALLARLAPGDHLLLATPAAAAATLSAYATLNVGLREFGVALRLCGAGAAGAAPVGGRVGRALRAVASEGLRPAKSLAAVPKAEQIKAGLAFCRANGLRTGRFPPIGFRFVRRGRHWHVEPDVAEIRLIVEGIVKWRQPPYCASWNDIARHLLRHQVKTSWGGDWTIDRIRRAVALAGAGRLPPLTETTRSP